MTERKLLNQKEEEKIPLTPLEERLLNMLKNRTLFPNQIIESTIFKSDLVLTLTAPQQAYLPRKEKIEIGSFLHAPNEHLLQAYQQAHEDLFKDMQRKGDDLNPSNQNELLIRMFSSIYRNNYDKQIREREKTKKENEKKEVKRSRGWSEKESAEKSEEEEVDYTKMCWFCDINHGSSQEIRIPCTHAYNGILDGFTIFFNTLIYVLAQECGFKVYKILRTEKKPLINLNPLSLLKKRNSSGIRESMSLSENVSPGEKTKIYVFLKLSSRRVYKAAHKFGVKKELSYERIDPFLNVPRDSCDRPLEYHVDILSLEQKIFHHSVNEKTVLRKMGFDIPQNEKKKVVNESKLRGKQIENYFKYLEQKDKLLQEFSNRLNNGENIEELSAEEMKYLKSVNRNKVNPGVIRQFRNKQMQLEYITQLTKIAHKSGFKTNSIPEAYTNFLLHSKFSTFFKRLDTFLIYKEQVSSPRGDLSLFNKMERVKVAYLIIKEKINLNGLDLFDFNLFPLHDSFELKGEVGDENSTDFHYHYKNEEPGKSKIDKKIKGGLNGKNLNDEWKILRFWQTDFQTLKNYLGESTTFEFFLKTSIILIFFFLAPFGIAGQILKRTLISRFSEQREFVPEIIFYLVYLFLTVLMFSIIAQLYKSKEEVYFKDYVDEKVQQEILLEYKGPYVRNLKTDMVNYFEKRRKRDKLLTFLFFAIILGILGAEIGFYYGIRAFIVDFAYQQPDWLEVGPYFFKPIHLICYSIYFIANGIIEFLIVRPLSKFLTSHQNQPTREKFNDSLSTKMLIFTIGIEMIGPIDLALIQPSLKTQCNSINCFFELQNYVYCRYIITLGFVMLQLIFLVVKFVLLEMKEKASLLIKRKKKLDDFSQQQIVESGSRMPFFAKLDAFINFVEKQEKLEDQKQIDLVDETVALVQFALYFMVFPIAPLISLFSMIITFVIERQDTMTTYKRPIQKSPKIEKYAKVMDIISQLLIIYSVFLLFSVLKWMEDLFQPVVLFFSPAPTVEIMIILRYALAIIFTLIYEVVARIGRFIGKRIFSFVEKRKYIFIERAFKNKIGHEIIGKFRESRPIQTISRTYNHIKSD